MLKDMGNVKKGKKFGKYIICSECKEKIFYETEEAKENIEKIANKKIYSCGCGNDIIID